MKPLYSDLSELLQEIDRQSNGDVFYAYEYENFPALKIWGYKIHHPGGANEFLIILPDENQAFVSDLPFEQEYYIVDCFQQFTGNSHAISPNAFITEFLFDTTGYMQYLKKNPVIKDIKRFYTDRTISFFNNQDKGIFVPEDNQTLEELLETWRTQSNTPLLILGERGIGKSWSVLKFCEENAIRFQDDPFTSALPIYFNLRMLSENIPGVTDFGELLLYHFRKVYNIRILGNVFTFHALMNTGKIILVLDGLDEMSKEISQEITIKNLWQIFTLYSNTTKFILTSRKNFFSSKAQIKEHFAFQKFFEQETAQQAGERIYNLEARRIRQNFNIWEIEPFKYETRLRFLELVHKIPDTLLEKGLVKLHELEQFEEHTIEREIFQLWDIPGYFLPILRLLIAKQPMSKFDLFEHCINSVIIQFNIETERAIDKFRTVGSGDPGLKGYVFNAEKKNMILRKLSWYMIERQIDEFSMTEFPIFIKEIEGDDYDVILNDLQSQTVITLKENGNYGFVSDSIFAFYVSNFLYLQLTGSSIDQITKGIHNVGKYNFKENPVLRKCAVFLQSKLSDLQDSEEQRDKIRVIGQLATEALVNDRPYSIWLRYLTRNLDLLGIDTTEARRSARDFWVEGPISNEHNTTDKSLVLIAGSPAIAPYFLGTTEVTNRQYYRFLQSNQFDGKDGKEECLGGWWTKKGSKDPDNPYRKIINYYHIIFYKTQTLIPVGKGDHPVVWISWFAAAKYCNWLSNLENIEPYYGFVMGKDGQFAGLRINAGSHGYRLPTEEEWMFASSEGTTGVDSFLDLFPNEVDKDRILTKFQKELFDTYPVKNENSNRLGVYGLMGNVREWVQGIEKNKWPINPYSEQVIKGIGWLFDEESFRLSTRSTLLAQNNNADTGFRVARSLSPEELDMVTQANERYLALTTDKTQQLS